MKYALTIVLLLITGGMIIAWRIPKKETTSCFTPEAYDRVLKYVIWKDQTSKIGKVLVTGYEVKPEADTLVFRKDGYTLFRITREAGITALAVKNQKRLHKKAEKAFCELLERAAFRGM